MECQVHSVSGINSVSAAKLLFAAAIVFCLNYKAPFTLNGYMKSLKFSYKTGFTTPPCCLTVYFSINLQIMLQKTPELDLLMLLLGFGIDW